MPNDPVTTLAALPARCLVGVSGGIDSIAMLHALVAAGKQPIVVHFDHGWRKESARDAQFVQALAKRLGLKCVGARASHGLKISEQSARAVRWSFFEKAAKRTRCYDLVLAHNADDQVETFLLQLLRGGGSGARGMRAKSKRGALIVHRPWLGVWRSEIAAYAKKNKLVWREDATNGDTRFRRNHLRHRVLPYLQKQVSKDAARALWRAAEILGAEAEWMEQLSSPHTGTRQLSVKTLRAMPVAQCRRVLRAWLTARGVSDIAFDDVESVRGLLENRFPARINLSGNRFCRRRAGYLFLESA